MTSKHPWETIKREYVEAQDEASRPSLEALADKYEISRGYVRQKAAADRWREQANIFLTKVEQKRKEQVSTLLASEQAQFDADCLKVARAGMQQIMVHLARAQKNNEPLKPSDLDTVLRAMERVRNIGKDALSDTAETEEKQDVVIYLPMNERDNESTNNAHNGGGDTYALGD